LKEETRNANQREQERIQRIKERQKYYNEVAPTPQADTLQEERLILEINPKNKEVVVEVNKELVKCLKSHQVQGIKFMYDSTIESVFKLEDPEGTGCILAHSMGLGKTLQVIKKFTIFLLYNVVIRKISSLLCLKKFNFIIQIKQCTKRVCRVRGVPA